MCIYVYGKMLLNVFLIYRYALFLLFLFTLGYEFLSQFAPQGDKNDPIFIEYDNGQ